MSYFLQRADGAIKIGTTREYYSRRATLASEHGQLELLGVMESGRDEEQNLHKQFPFAQIPYFLSKQDPRPPNTQT